MKKLQHSNCAELLIAYQVHLLLSTIKN